MKPSANDVANFEQAVSCHLRALHRFAASLVPLVDADDLVQDALLRAWQRRGDFDPDRGSVRAWLLAFVADQARQRWRRRRQPTIPLDLDLHVDAIAGPDGAPTDVRRAISELAPRQRTAIVLRHYVDLTYAEIAVVMNCSVGTVRSTLHDAHARLHTLLGVPHVQR